jgi:hypothetical protein
VASANAALPCKPLTCSASERSWAHACALLCISQQVANYPSQLIDPGSSHHLRKKAHVDSGTLTLLASEDWLPGSNWQAGEGGLQLLNTQLEWLELQVPTGGDTEGTG